jgi:hypothetical protein
MAINSSAAYIASVISGARRSIRLAIRHATLNLKLIYEKKSLLAAGILIVALASSARAGIFIQLSPEPPPPPGYYYDSGDYPCYGYYGPGYYSWFNGYWQSGYYGRHGNNYSHRGENRDHTSYGGGGSHNNVSRSASAGAGGHSVDGGHEGHSHH